MNESTFESTGNVSLDALSKHIYGRELLDFIAACNDNGIRTNDAFVVGSKVFDEYGGDFFDLKMEYRVVPLIQTIGKLVQSGISADFATGTCMDTPTENLDELTNTYFALHALDVDRDKAITDAAFLTSTGIGLENYQALREAWFEQPEETEDLHMTIMEAVHDLSGVRKGVKDTRMLTYRGNAHITPDGELQTPIPKYSFSDAVEMAKELNPKVTPNFGEVTGVQALIAALESDATREQAYAFAHHMQEDTHTGTWNARDEKQLCESASAYLHGLNSGLSDPQAGKLASYAPDGLSSVVKSFSELTSTGMEPSLAAERAPLFAVNADGLEIYRSLCTQADPEKAFTDTAKILEVYEDTALAVVESAPGSSYSSRIKSILRQE